MRNISSFRRNFQNKIFVIRSLELKDWYTQLKNSFNPVVRPEYVILKEPSFSGVNDFLKPIKQTEIHT
jgi:hypothetical protein